MGKIRTECPRLEGLFKALPYQDSTQACLGFYLIICVHKDYYNFDKVVFMKWKILPSFSPCFSVSTPVQLCKQPSSAEAMVISRMGSFEVTALIPTRCCKGPLSLPCVCAAAMSRWENLGRGRGRQRCMTHKPRWLLPAGRIVHKAGGPGEVRCGQGKWNHKVTVGKPLPVSTLSRLQYGKILVT